MWFELTAVLLFFILQMVNGWVCFAMGRKSVTKEPFFDSHKIEIYSPEEEKEEKFAKEDAIQI